MASRHVLVYEHHFGELTCELTGAPHSDCHHISARGMGGRKSADKIENLMALCRSAHDFYGDKTKYKEWLKEWHIQYMDHRTPMYIMRPDDEIFQEYLNYKYGSIRL